MMNFRLSVPLPDYPFRIRHADALFLSGSCFTEHFGQRFQTVGFEVLAQPFGTQFNPLVMAESLHRILDLKEFCDSDLVFHDGLWYSWWHHSRFHHAQKEMLLAQLNEALHQQRDALLKSRYVFITWGTARSYTWKENGLRVANCHKVPSREFETGFDDATHIAETWLKLIHRLKLQCPKMDIVFTVSPVKYRSADPLENSVGKGMLFAALEWMRQRGPLWYFPAYELMNDELRDYRFYADDMQHPSSQAIQWIWERCCEVWMDEATRQLVARAEALQRDRNHKVMQAGSTAHAAFLKHLAEREATFLVDLNKARQS